MSSTFVDFWRGETISMTLTVKDEDEGTIDITDETLKFLLKENKDDSDANAKIDKDATLSAPLVGRATLTLSNTNTDQTPGLYYYEFILIRTTGEEYVLESDKVYIKERLLD